MENDTKQQETEWIGFNLDKTLAKYDFWVSETDIGEPIQPMINLVRRYLADGITVKIFTARIATTPNEHIISAIQDWTEKHIGQRLEVTNVKDWNMSWLFDDRAISVEANTGQLTITKNKVKRAYSLNIDLGADNKDEMINQLNSIVSRIKSGEVSSICGGHSIGYLFNVWEDPYMTNEKYFEELKRF